MKDSMPIEEKIGLIDILVNNAGINLRVPLDQFKDIVRIFYTERISGSR
jgi:NADP-dependent 3-hydroxy acid dehydrogenase YdfG